MSFRESSAEKQGWDRVKNERREGKRKGKERKKKLKNRKKENYLFNFFLYIIYIS